MPQGLTWESLLAEKAADKAAYEQSVIEGKKAEVIADTATDVLSAGTGGPAVVDKINEQQKRCDAQVQQLAQKQTDRDRVECGESVGL